MKNNHNRSAFTLIEVLITIVILSTGIVGILYSFDASMNALSDTRGTLFCTVLCRDKLTDIESDIVLGQAPEVSSFGLFDGIYKDYQWSADTRLVPDDMDDDNSNSSGENNNDVNVELYKVRVFVWQENYPDDRQEAVTYFKL